MRCPEGSSDGGYAVSDYRAIHPDIGTMDELAQLARRGEHQAQMLSNSTRSALQIVEGLRTSAESKLAQTESISSGYSEFLGPVRLPLDDGDVVPLAGEAVGDVVADLTGSDDDGLQGLSGDAGE